jgi:hypothetical protein
VQWHVYFELLYTLPCHHACFLTKVVWLSDLSGIRRLSSKKHVKFWNPKEVSDGVEVCNLEGVIYTITVFQVAKYVPMLLVNI